MVFFSCVGIPVILEAAMNLVITQHRNRDLRIISLQILLSMIYIFSNLVPLARFLPRFTVTITKVSYIVTWGGAWDEAFLYICHMMSTDSHMIVGDVT